jgi:hypothetical protein
MLTDGRRAAGFAATLAEPVVRPSVRPCSRCARRVLPRARRAARACARGPSLPCPPLRATARARRGRRGEGACGADSAGSGGRGAEADPARVMAARRRCTECRQWYEASLSARETQKVCGKECRNKRRRKLARRRRQERLQEARVEERERQHAWRAARRRPGTVFLESAPPASSPTASSEPSPAGEARDGPRAPPCHAPPWSSKPREVLGKVLELWDSEMARSRATLERRMAGILRRIAREAGTARNGSGAPSRATLPP